MTGCIQASARKMCAISRTLDECKFDDDNRISECTAQKCQHKSTGIEIECKQYSTLQPLFLMTLSISTVAVSGFAAYIEQVAPPAMNTAVGHPATGSFFTVCNMPPDFA